MDATNDYFDDSNFSSLFSPSTTSPPSTNPADDDTPTRTNLYRARLILENHLYDELLNRYKLAVTRLREFTTEANTLQEENEWLRLANDDLTRRLNGLLTSPPEQHGTSTNDQNVVGNNSPTSVINDDGEERFSLPKSISVRSPGYFKLMSSSPPPGSPVDPSNKSLHPSSSHDSKGTKLRLRGEDEMKALEMEVYNQGMYKTELCNKWQETGTCPYGDHCRFAHGVSELRPVVRHPRYKTQVCRMIRTGGTCPYGHRCHFRHSLSPTPRLN